MYFDFFEQSTKYPITVVITSMITATTAPTPVDAITFATSFIVEITDKIATADVFMKTELLQRDQTLILIEEGLNELNPEQKLCVTLFYLEKKSYTEIAAATGFTLMQVKSYIQNGKRNLKILIEKKMKA